MNNSLEQHGPNFHHSQKKKDSSLWRKLQVRQTPLSPLTMKQPIWLSISHMSLCQKVLGEDNPFFYCKFFFRFKFSLNKPNFIQKSMHQRDNKDKLDSQSQSGVSKIWKFTPSPGRKSAKEGWTFWVHHFSYCFVCIFLLLAIFPLLPHRT